MEENIPFEQLRAGDRIDNDEVYEVKKNDGTTEFDQDMEHYIVLHDHTESTIDKNKIIVESFSEEEWYSGMKTITKEDYDRKKMKGYRI